MQGTIYQLMFHERKIAKKVRTFEEKNKGVFTMEDRDNWSDREVIMAFTRMLRTVLLWVPWFGITLFFAVIKDWAFFDRADIPTWAHILFFAWVIVTSPLIGWVTLKKIWKM